MTESLKTSLLIRENNKLKEELQSLMVKQLENFETNRQVSDESDAVKELFQLKKNLEKSEAKYLKLHDESEDTLALNRKLELQSLVDVKNTRSAETKANKQQKEWETMKSRLSVTEKELKELKSLNPVSLKKNLVKQKQKVAEQLKLLTKLTSDNKILKSGKAESDAKLTNALTSLDRMLCETDGFWGSDDDRWHLRMCAFKFADEEESTPEDVVRIRCLDRKTGTSVLGIEVDEDGKAVWSSDIGVPDEMSFQAAKEIESLKDNGSLVNNVNPLQIQKLATA